MYCIINNTGDCFNASQVNVHFLYYLKTLFSDIFREHKKKTMTWDGLLS